MPWIKRNLTLVIWGGAALSLLLAAFVFLFQQKAHEAQTTEDLDREIADLTRLYQADPFPSAANIEKAKQEQQRAQALLNELGRHFPSGTRFQGDNFAFKKLLDETIGQLKRDAQAASVTLPPDYNFTFYPQRRAVNFSPESLAPMAARIEELKGICSVLFRTRVHAIEGMRRIAVSEHDVVGSADIIPRSAATNELTGHVRVPYEVTFTGFSAELANVLEAFGREPQFCVVKSLAVEPAPVPPPNPTPNPVGTVIPRPVPGYPPGVPRPPGSGTDPEMRDPDAEPPPEPTDEDESRPRPPPGAPAYQLPQRRPVLATVLDEKLLRFTLMVEVINPPSAN